MIYRHFSEKISFKPSAIGFGLMRLPMRADNTTDVEESIRLVRHSIDQGVNFLDTAYVYHGGESEKIMAKVLKDGYREKVKIADKMPMWLLQEEGDLDRIFFEQLERLGVDKIDFYMLHSLSKNSFATIEKFNALNWIEQKKADGYIEYAGFSFHDDLTCLKQLVDLHDWDFCLLQFNIIDMDSPVGAEGIRYAREKGLGIIIMEGLRGGQLTVSIPNDIRKLWDEMAKLHGVTKYNPAQFMLDWIWDNEDVGLIISGMSTFEQVEQNVNYANMSVINKMNQEQQELFKKIRQAYLQRTAINCTKCDYCKMCPQKIAIAYIFDQLNEIKRYDNQKTPTFRYGFLGEERRANKCTDCNACVPICPQKLDIPALLKLCSKVFDEKLAFCDVFK